MGLKSILFNKDVFPTTFSLVIFIVYMALFVSQGLLVTASRNGSSTYPYNPTTVVLLTEVLKLLLSSSTYIKEHGVDSLLTEVVTNVKILGYYMIPAFLYCLYNNLSFTNLANFDPTTYFMFLQIRLLLTGVIYQFLFKRRLSSIQWFSLLLVTIGCMIQKMDVGALMEVTTEQDPQKRLNMLAVSTGVLLIFVQMCCSVFAGVYNEYLIKHIAGNSVHIMIQNVFMYVDSIICNLIVLGLKGDLATAFTADALASICQIFVVAIIVNNSLVGIVTSLFLKNLNSIMKAFASALELVFTAIFSFLLLGLPLYWNTVIAVAVVSYAVVLYAQNPIKMPEEKTKIPKSEAKKEDAAPLLSPRSRDNEV